jgi:hypothetical protein
MGHGRIAHASESGVGSIVAELLGQCRRDRTGSGARRFVLGESERDDGGRGWARQYSLPPIKPRAAVAAVHPRC